MKAFITLILITLASCSTTDQIKPGKPSESRVPSSVVNEPSCTMLVGSFLQSPSNEVLTKKALIEKGIINEQDLKILAEDSLKNSLPDNAAEKEQMEMSYLLIKKQVPHFNQEQILTHYQLLKESCGV